jgi:DNA polymerase III subunit delta'
MPIEVFPWHLQQWRGLLSRRVTLPHALLIHGREGIGKLDFARKLAQSLVCAEPADDGAACGVCRSCRWFADGNHPDYREIFPAALREDETRSDGADEASSEITSTGRRKPSQEIKIEEVRELQDFINLTAHQHGMKIVLFYPAETLNVNAANALLKSLEEPPVGTCFMLVSHRPSFLPATIISRCQQIALSVPSSKVAEQWLYAQGVKEPALSLAQTGQAPLAALSLNDGDFWIQRKALLDGLVTREADTLSLAEKIREYPAGLVLRWMQQWSYDLLSAKSIGRVRYNPDFEKDAVQLIAHITAVAIVRHHRELLRLQKSINHPLNPRLFVEQLLLSYARLLRGERAHPI